MSQLPVTIISAGAGSGKTYTLTERMVAMLRDGVRPGGIVATTFTQKAAAELQERVRVKLLELGMNEAANELGTALIGTVHSIGVKLLQRFAFELGVSPLVEVIADGDGQRLFNESLSQVLTPDRIDRMNLLADRLGLTKKTMGAPFDWRRDIRNITEVARANNFSAQTLQWSKQRSWETFRAFLPDPDDTDALTWQNRVISGIEQAIAALDNNTADTTEKTRKAAEELRSIETQLKWRGELYWYEWVKIAKIAPGKKSDDLLADLRELANAHDRNRQFHDDIKGYIDEVFDIAADALTEYEAYKKKRGLIDYTDMEVGVSRLLRIPSVQDTLRTEIDLLLVDEFQDTSPIQLDIFLQLSRLARHSIWVGDPKQSIYGFRGAEPALMQAIIRATGGIKDENILKTSWRSRQDIVESTNAIFSKAFTDLPSEQVVLQPAKHALGHGGILHWFFKNEIDANKVPGQPWLDNCIATQIGVMLERQIPVWNKNRTATRPVRPGDIAVLCRSNDDCIRMATALHRAGLKASIARAGLLDTPEIRLILAYLKRIVNANDQLSAWEIVLITGERTLEQLVHNPAQLAELVPPILPGSKHMGVNETLTQLIGHNDLRRIMVRLGNPAQRLDNLERLRRFALDYESACDRIHAAATVSGFLIWLNRLAEQGLDLQGSGESDDAVKVLTYHKSKGLEYPVAICHSLAQGLREQIWGVNIVSEQEPDLNDILGGRWIRFWVNPYSDQKNNTPLLDAIESSDAFAQARLHALGEETRLLYVGITRARDYLIFPNTAKGTGWLNRVFNHGDESVPTLDSDDAETPFYRSDGSVILAETEVIYQPKDFPEAEPDDAPVPFFSPFIGRREYSPYHVQTGFEAPPGGQSVNLSDPIAFAPWLEFKGDYQTALVDALRSFLLSDDSTLATGKRLERIVKVLEIRRISDQLSPNAVLQHSNLFQAWIQQTFAPQSVQTWYQAEKHLNSPRGNRLVRLQADMLLIDQHDQPVVIQLMPFAEGMQKWKTLAQAKAPELAWWRWVLQRDDVDMWLVFGLEGSAVEVR